MAEEAMWKLNTQWQLNQWITTIPQLISFKDFKDVHETSNSMIKSYKSFQKHLVSGDITEHDFMF